MRQISGSSGPLNTSRIANAVPELAGAVFGGGADEQPTEDEDESESSERPVAVGRRQEGDTSSGRLLLNTRNGAIALTKVSHLHSIFSVPIGRRRRKSFICSEIIAVGSPGSRMGGGCAGSRGFRRSIGSVRLPVPVGSTKSRVITLEALS